MKQHKYVALDVDSANIVAGVFDSQGRSLMQTHLRTEAKVIQESPFIGHIAPPEQRTTRWTRTYRVPNRTSIPENNYSRVMFAPELFNSEPVIISVTQLG